MSIDDSEAITPQREKLHLAGEIKGVKPTGYVLCVRIVRAAGLMM